MNIEDFIFAPTKEDIDFINRQIEDANKRVVLTKDNIIMYMENGAPYEIELRRCETIQDVVDWIFHMKEKWWVTDFMLKRMAKFMCNHNNRYTFLVKTLKKLHNLCTRLGIKRTCRLIRKQNFGMIGNGSCNSYSLTLST